MLSADRSTRLGRRSLRTERRGSSQVCQTRGVGEWFGHLPRSVCGGHCSPLVGLRGDPWLHSQRYSLCPYRGRDATDEHTRDCRSDGRRLDRPAEDFRARVPKTTDGSSRGAAVQRLDCLASGCHIHRCIDSLTTASTDPVGPESRARFCRPSPRSVRQEAADSVHRDRSVAAAYLTSASGCRAPNRDLPWRQIVYIRGTHIRPSRGDYRPGQGRWAVGNLDFDRARQSPAVA